MGFFSTDRKVHVSTTTVRVIENDMLPNSVAAGSVKALFEEGDMTEYILEEMVHNITSKANKAFKYAKKHSHLGLPHQELIQKEAGTDEVLRILKTKYGDGGTLHHCYFGVPNLYHFGWEALVANGYNTKTNLIDSKYLDYFAIEINPETFSEYGEDTYLPHSISPYMGYKPWEDTSTYIDFFPPVNMTAELDKPRLLVVSGIQENLPDADITYTRRYLEFPLLVSNKDYFQACYEFNGVKYYWSYQKGTGEYPVLDSIGNTSVSSLGTYYPFIHFIHDKKILSDNKDSRDYKLTEKLCELLEIDAEPIFEQLEYNPDIKQVNQATLMFAIPAFSESEAEQQYCFEFFKAFAEGSNEKLPLNSSTSLFTRKTHTQGKTLIIADAKFRSSISFSHVILKRKAGTISGRGKYASSVGSGTTSYEVKNPVTGIVFTHTTSGTIHRYSHQIAPGLYDEIEVVNLRVAYRVFEDYMTTGDGTSNILLLPLDKAVLDRCPVNVREEVVGRSLRFVFNSYQIQYIQFYERGPFKALVTIFAVVFTIWTAGTGAGFMSAIAAGGTVALAAIWSTVILPILQVSLVTEGAKVFVKLFGEDLALLAAIVAIAYGAYATNAGSLFADNLIRVGNSLINQVQKSIQQELQALQEDLTEFQKNSADMYQMLEDTASDLLSGNLLAKVPEVVFGEHPQSYYGRTVHSGNIGVQSIAAVSNYVPLALKLPSFNETLQGFENGTLS